MKRALLLSLLLAAAPAAFAQMKGMDTKDMPMKTQKTGGTHKANGVVTKMGADSVTIRHEPVKTINWPTMFVQEGKDYVVTGVK